MHSYISSVQMPRDAGAIASWNKPGGVGVRAEIDFEADRLMVQLEHRGVTMGMSLGSAQVSEADIHYMLSETYKSVVSQSKEKMRNQARPHPRWYIEVMEKIERWGSGYLPWVFDEVSRLLKEVEISDMPESKISFNVSGTPKISWQLGDRRIQLEVREPRRFSYCREGGGLPKEGGVFEIDASTRLRELMEWLREGATPRPS